MGDSRLVLSRDVDAGTLGLSGVTLAAARTSNAFSVSGFDQLTVFVNLSAQSAATDVQTYIEVSDDNSTWYRMQTGSISSGTETLSDHIFVKAVSAADTFLFNVAVNAYEFCRIVIDGTSGGASDVVSVYVRRSNL